MRTLVEVRRVHFFEALDFCPLDVEVARCRCDCCGELICEYNIYQDINEDNSEEEPYSVL